VIEDDADIREVMIEALVAEGHRAAAAASGTAALAQLRDGMKPELILLDSNMAGMNGAAFRAEQLRDPALADIPVLLLSGGGDLAELAASLQVQFLRKPFRLSELIAAVNELCVAAR
jgi:CheY-like chemotaxis protein